MSFAGDIHYRESSAGDNKRSPLVLVHGAGGSLLHWPTEVRRMAGERVLAIDLPGHGKSAAGGATTIGAYTSSVIDFLDSMRIDEAVLAGHSMGSAILQRLSLDHPEREKGLILIGAGANLPVNPTILQSCSSEETYPEVVSMVMEWSFSPTADRRLVELAGERMAEMSYEVVQGDFYACDAFDVQDRLAEINSPTLVICGADDKMTPLRFSEHLAEEMPAARLEIVPVAGHMVMLEKPKITAALIKEFLNQLSAVDYADG